MTASPKKSLGQHWLQDKTSLNGIIDAAEIVPGDSVLEIGPGLGTLTDRLLARNAHVTALEFDSTLIDELQKKYKNRDNIAIIEGDIRTFDLTKMTPPYKIVANIPYYLTSNLIRLLSESNNQPSLSALLVQKEVAERICAPAGAMSILSVIAQLHFDCSLGLVVPAKLFTPPPKIDSQVVILKQRKAPLFSINEETFLRLVKAGFSERRKSLRNSLSGGLRLQKNEVELLLEKSSIDPIRRAQTLSLEEWNALYIAFSQE